MDPRTLSALPNAKVEVGVPPPWPGAKPRPFRGQPRIALVRCGISGCGEILGEVVAAVLERTGRLLPLEVPDLSVEDQYLSEWITGALDVDPTAPRLHAIKWRRGMDTSPGDLGSLTILRAEPSERLFSQVETYRSDDVNTSRMESRWRMNYQRALQLTANDPGYLGLSGEAAEAYARRYADELRDRHELFYRQPRGRGDPGGDATSGAIGDVHDGDQSLLPEGPLSLVGDLPIVVVCPQGARPRGNRRAGRVHLGKIHLDGTCGEHCTLHFPSPL
jgi:hypothetical protein